MGFILLLLYLVLMLIRPFELYPSLASGRIMLVGGIIAILGTVISLLTGPRPTFRAAQIYLMGGLMVMIALSVIIAQRWFGGALQAILYFGTIGRAAKPDQ